ncbi:MAG: sialate O-acetylesterase [Thermodesulfobacteriota bacterium]
MTISSPAHPSVDTSPQKTAWLPGFAALLAVAAVFHILEYQYLQNAYATHMPHYDSMGSYMYMYEVMNTLHAQGFFPALKLASGHFLSWGMSFFALVFSPVLRNTPQSLLLFHTLCILVFMLSVHSAALALGKDWKLGVAASLMIFLPDTFYSWQGGLHDLQRDISFVALLGAACFLFFAAVWKPSVWKSLSLGFVAALSVWSRDNGIFWFILIFCPIVGVWLLGRLRRRDFGTPRRVLVPALLPFAAMVLPFLLLCYASIRSRMGNTYLRWAFGHDILASLREFWDVPLLIFFGRVGPLTSLDQGTWVATLSLVGGLGACLVALRLCAVLRFDRSFLLGARGLSVLGAGVWSLFITSFLLIAYLKLTPSQSGLGYHSVKHMFYTSLLGFFFLLFYLVTAVAPGRRAPSGRVLLGGLGVVCLILAWAGIHRTLAKTPPAEPEHLHIAQELSTTVSIPGREASTVAFMWHDKISIDALRYFSLQKGRDAIKKLYYPHPLNTSLELDFAVNAPENEIPALLQSLHEHTMARADYVVCNASPGAYSTPKHHYFFFRHGQPVVDSLLRDPEFETVYRFTLLGQPFVVLKNLRRFAAARPGEDDPPSSASGPGIPRDMDIFLLMGQSNMSGRGRLGDVSPTAAPEGVWMYANSGQWKPAAEPVDDAAGQVDEVSLDANAGYGPSLAFGMTLRELTGRPVGLVPCAKGASGIDAWLPSTSRGTLYGSCLARAREAGRHGVVRGVLWLQGENDAMRQGLAEAWPGRFETIVAALRTDLGDAALPVVFAQLGADPDDARFRFWEAVKKSQAAVAIAGTDMITTEDLPHDGVHFTAQGYALLGARLARAAAALGRPAQ